MRRPSWRRALCALGLLLTLAACAAPPPSALDRLHACRSDEGPTDAYCGTLTVFENRQTRQGRTLDLRIVVLPALSSDAQIDPLFFLAGGPGQGAAELARTVREMFRQVQNTRDIVLVDQRGTGKSHPLDCRSDDDSLAGLNEPDAVALQRLRACLAGYDADTRLYTTPVAMDDLDEVRAWLGYEHINLYGGSYGTRAALVYLRQHGARVRSVILDGVAPPDMRLPLYFARDAERALDRLFADCAADVGCNAKYPNLDARTRALFARLEAAPFEGRLVHPRTGIAEHARMEGRAVASIVHAALYAPLVSSLVPELLVRAESGDYQGMLALGLMNDGAAENMAVGMHMSVVCSEDRPRVTPEDVARETAGTVFARHLLTARMDTCTFWPRGEMPAGYYEPVVSAVPALVLSGDLDPVTPPSWGEGVAKHLSNSRHIIAPGTGHGVLQTGCGQRLARQFVASGTVSGLDDSCLAGMTRPPFFLSPAGPDPMAQTPATPPRKHGNTEPRR